MVSSLSSKESVVAFLPKFIVSWLSSMERVVAFLPKFHNSPRFINFIKQSFSRGAPQLVYKQSSLSKSTIVFNFPQCHKLWKEAT